MIYTRPLPIQAFSEYVTSLGIPQYLHGLVRARDPDGAVSRMKNLFSPIQ